MSTQLSPAIGMLNIVWENANTAVPHSWERLNHAMSNALSLVVGAGFKFEINDVRYIMEHYRSGYWIGESNEWLYAIAVRDGNLSAARSFEAYKDRKAFIADDVYPGDNHDKLKKRFTITRKDIIADRAERKERAGLQKALETAASTNGNTDATTKALGVKTQSDLEGRGL